MGGDPYGSGTILSVEGADLRDSSGSTGDFKGTFGESPPSLFESGKEIYKPVIAARS